MKVTCRKSPYAFPVAATPLLGLHRNIGAPIETVDAPLRQVKPHTQKDVGAIGRAASVSKLR